MYSRATARAEAAPRFDRHSERLVRRNPSPFRLHRRELGRGMRFNGLDFERNGCATVQRIGVALAAESMGKEWRGAAHVWRHSGVWQHQTPSRRDASSD